MFQVKLNPSLADAWLCLGNCIWKKGDLASAKNCFSLALNKVFLTLSFFSFGNLAEVSCSHDCLFMDLFFLLFSIFFWFRSGSKQEDSVSVVNA